ncbi:pyridoxal phosphate-dependent aminotransferase [Membranihabitans maritimus]|uniref:pyridoxal phosphate-dependent aminotransferase n=1 Tax=Membranihabitans maritimus TaxID=2904244 RepID=UPI001EFFA224|nr:aminotransferase class I/II-fold pyridoxal phosphate-dependent enzyme [Membranihabitans maritimus]
MKVETAHRIQSVKEYYFSKKLKEIASLKKAGKNILNLGIGSPDLPPDPSVIETLNSSAANIENHGYQSYYGIPELRVAFANWYKKRYRVSLNPDSEILPLIGSKEGIMHISMTFLNPGDEVLIPDPGYPTYSSATQLAGGTIRKYDLDAKNHWYPDFTALEELDLSKVKLMWINYPNMPTGSLPSNQLFEELISFGRKHNIIICHDNPYSFILNNTPMSILSFDRAKECCLELNSLSKSHNMAGWRIGMIGGCDDFLKEIIKFKSNMDSGMFRPLQEAAIKALSLGDDWYNQINEVYKERKNKAYQLLDLLGCQFQKDQAGLFVWGKVPKYYKDGFELSDRYLYETDVFITPGGIFGDNGNQYIRISICSKSEVLQEANSRINAFLNRKMD